MISSFTDDGERLKLQLLAQYGAPAYIRRARQTELAYDDLLECCRAQRREFQRGIRRVLAVLLSPDVLTKVARWQRQDAVRWLHRLRCALEPPTLAPNFSGAARSIRALWRELLGSVDRFNSRFTAFLEQIDLAELNRLRDGYNRYFLIEKECAIGSERMEGTSFRSLTPVTREELRRLFPPLPVPTSQLDSTEFVAQV
jgi:hypothetical protein